MSKDNEGNVENPIHFMDVIQPLRAEVRALRTSLKIAKIKVKKLERKVYG